MTPPEDGVPGPEPDLGPFLAELTGDLSSLERFPEPLVELLAAAGLSAGARVLDVACGKGAAALALAVKLGVEVDGVDEEDAYVLAAEAEARRRGLPCRFRQGLAHEALAAAAGNPRDAVLCIGLGRPFGTLGETVAQLRRAVRPGGLVLIEDGFVLEGVSGPVHDHEGYGGRAAALAELCRHGDLVVGEWLAPKEDVCAQNASDLAALRTRAEAIAVRRPDLRAALNLWLGHQAMQARLLESSLQSAAWLLRRGPG